MTLVWGVAGLIAAALLFAVTRALAERPEGARLALGEGGVVAASLAITTLLAFSIGELARVAMNLEAALAETGPVHWAGLALALVLTGVALRRLTAAAPPAAAPAADTPPAPRRPGRPEPGRVRAVRRGRDRAA